MKTISSFRRRFAADRRGFTLVEIMAVLAVMAAIIAIGVPAISKALQSGRIRNSEGSATILKGAITLYLGKPGSIGTLPVTEGVSPALTSEYTGTGAPTPVAVGDAATLDNVLLAENVLERPISLRMGAQNAAVTGAANGFAWSPNTESFGGAAPPTLSYAAISRAECAVSDGVTNPGASTGAHQSLGSYSCAFNLNGDGATFIPNGTRVAYMIIKSVSVNDAYQLALDVDGPNLTQNTVTAPAGVDQTQGSVVYAKDGTNTGFVDIYYYLTTI
jgi:prepilin-type N-terminal cleavage/methylation domain-containing protein